jgi:hypothetical protein
VVTALFVVKADSVLGNLDDAVTLDNFASLKVDVGNKVEAFVHHA